MTSHMIIILITHDTIIVIQVEASTILYYLITTNPTCGFCTHNQCGKNQSQFNYNNVCQIDFKIIITLYNLNLLLHLFA